MKKHILKTLSFAVSILILLSVLPFSSLAVNSTVTSGKTGDCTWELDGTVLTISGNGAMADYGSFNDAPWGTNITKIIIESGITSIGNSAFDGCTNLTSITIPDGVTNIGDYAFCRCKGLTSITIPNSVKSIGYKSFYICTELTSITIPDGVTSIGDSAFSWCTKIQTMIVEKNNSVFYSNGNCIIRKKNKELIAGCRNSVIPADDSVTSIGDYAFYGCEELTSMIIPNSVVDIGIYVFSYCTGLTSVTIPNSVTIIGAGTFSNCTGLTSVTIPDSIISIGSSAFSGCTELTSINIPDSVTNIGDNAFHGCTGLTSITIPNGVTSIGESLFFGCTGLTSITIPDGITSIGNLTFCRCTGLTSVTIPDSIAIIGDYVFSYCTGLTSVTIPNGVTSIGESLFFGCTGLTNVTIPDSITSIGSSAFSGCTELTSINIPDSVTNIGDNAFRGCTGLTSITIPDSVTWIGSSAFDNTNPNSVIYTSENSTAYKYAKSNNIKLYLTKITRYISPPDLEKMQSNGNISVKITLKPTDNYEYKCNNGSWQKSNIFDNLSFDTDYTFYQRLGKTSENVASSPSDTKIIHTKKKNISVPVAPEIISKTAFSITLKEIDGYEYSIDGINWQKSNVFGGLKAIYEYTFFQRIAETESFSSSEKSNGLTVVTLKSDNKEIPKKPEMETKTDTSITGYEYSIDNVNWQNEPVFENLEPETEYCLYQRVAETDTIYASKSSDALSVKTFPKYYCTECLNTGLNSDKTKCETCFGTGRFHIAGDADSDYEITDWDSVLCKRYLAGWDVEIFSKKCFDIDGDRKVTDWDGVLFERYLAGWETNTKICSIVKGYPKHNHILGDWIIDRKATCVLAGEEYKICSICDDIIEERIISKLPHDFENWITDKVSTCYATGEKHHICKECGYSEINVIPKKSHSYGDWIIDKAATCSVFGSRHKVCSVCGASSVSESFRELHKYGVWIIDMQPTCSHAGSRHRECTVCKEKNVESIKQLEHSPGSVTYYDKESTCISHGTGYRLCTKCGGRCNGFQLPLKPHNYVNGKCTYCNQRKN